MIEIKQIVSQLHPLERKVLPILAKEHLFDNIVKISKLKDVEVMRALQWLENKAVIQISEEIKEAAQLGKNGIKYEDEGLPEEKFLNSIKEKPLTQSELLKQTKLNEQEFNICIGLLKKEGVINLKKDKQLVISLSGKSYSKDASNASRLLKKLKSSNSFELSMLSPEEHNTFEALKKRNDIVNINIKKIKTVKLTGIGIQLLQEKISDDVLIESITPDVLKTGIWKNKKIRAYDVQINVPRTDGGRKHFVSQTIRYIKQIWLDMGFEEMTGNYIQTSYWDLDCLFVPQDHPAREMQDTFYLGEKEVMKGDLPKDYQKIKNVHENGGNSGSSGWGAKWSKEEAEKLLLRTHMTVLSALQLNKISKDDLPKKYFSVGKVFRNEALDWKHLFEFYQVDGIVIDENVNLKNHKAYLRQFFGKMGFPDVRMRPAHFPYTEPSMEIDVWHPKKKQWVEFGGSGIFRPEVVRPLLGVDVPVLAWGLGLDRIISEYFEITDIRELYKNNIKQLREIKMWLK